MRWTRFPLAGALVAVILLMTATVATASEGESVVVRFQPGTPAAQRSRALLARGLELVEDAPGSDFVLAQRTGSVRTAGGASAGAVAEIAPAVEMRLHATPNDPGYSAQWHLPMVQAPAGWEVTTGSGVVVAVIDTGVASHTRSIHTRAPDLADTTFVAGWDFVDGDSMPDDHHGHGTHVAGTIAQSTNNSIGVAGLAHGATIMPLRALDASGSGSDWNVAQALRFAADNGAKIANLSLGTPTASAVVADAVAYAASNGMVIVASTGNDGLATVSYPAAYPEVTAVGAVRYDRTRAPYSNYGAEVDLVAPGGDTDVDQNGDGYPDGVLQQTLKDGTIGDFCYCFMAGTSMAAPHVSAAAAMIVAQGTSSRTAVRDLLVDSAADLGPAGWDGEHGHGLLQTRDALDLGAARSATAPAPEPEPETAPTEAAPGADFEAGVSARSIDEACPTDSVPRGIFDDVSTSDVHARAIDCVSWWDVTQGVTSTTFDPRGTVTRAQMASFVARSINETRYNLPSSPPDAFSDDNGSPHEHRINQLAAVGVVQGTSHGNYTPGAAVARSTMTTFLVRAHDLVAGTKLQATQDYFDDDNGSFHETNTNRAAEAGLAAGTASRTFSPHAAVRRNQMASFLARTLDLLVESGHASVPE